MKLLTPEQVLQAIKENEPVEVKFGEHYEWTLVDKFRMGIDELLDSEHLFRFPQAMVKIGDVSFPKPETKPLEMNTEYWVADPISSNFTAQNPSKWENDTQDNRFLSRGFIHLSKENAIAHSKALIKLSGGTYE